MTRLIPIGIPWTVASARRRNVKFVNLEEKKLPDSSLSGRIDIQGKIKRTQIITIWPIHGKPGWWHVKYRDNDGSIVYADVQSQDIE